MNEPVEDTMGHRLEAKITGLLELNEDLADVKVMFKGEPGFIPADLYPFLTEFLAVEAEAIGQEGFGQETGHRYFRYDGYLSVEALLKDAAGIADEIYTKRSRVVEVPSYAESRRLTQAARQTLLAWGGEDGRRVEADPVQSFDGKEITVELHVDNVVNALQQRPDNVSNRGNVQFHLYTRRRDV